MRTAVELSAESRLQVIKYAKGALIAGGALGRVPTPLDDVATARELSTVEELFDRAEVPEGLMQRLWRLSPKVKGRLDIGNRTIYLDPDQIPTQRRFTQGHEIGHDALPWHKDAYDGADWHTLRPATRDELEAEANAFSAELLFNLDEFTQRAHSSALSLALAVDLAGQFNASCHAAIRRYVEDAPRNCALLVLSKRPFRHGRGASLRIERGIQSKSFRKRYGPITACLPRDLPLTKWQLAKDGYAALSGESASLIDSGTIALSSSSLGIVEMDYEAFCNTYRVFVLLIPRRRRTRRRSVRP